MDEQEVRKIIQDELLQYSIKNQYAGSNVPVHNHDNLNSPRVDANTLQFGQPYFKLFLATTTPTAVIPGAIANVNGKLVIYNGTSWVVVGTQT